MRYILTITSLLSIVTVLLTIEITANKIRRVKRCQSTSAARSGPIRARPNYPPEVEDYNKGWPQTCIKGKLQSPINLQKSTAVRRDEEITFHGYEQFFYADLLNNGHSVKLKILDHLEGISLPYVTGSALDWAEYKLQSFHFHWDAEHTIDGYRFPLEAHFVHLKTQFLDFEEAIKHDHGVTIFSVMYRVQDACPSNIFNTITKDIPKVERRVGIPHMIKTKISIFDFLPLNRGNFFMYDGSLTTPDCPEGAHWIVFEYPNCIEQEQLELLTNVYTKNGTLITKNYRILQHLNERKVYYTTLLRELDETDVQNETEIS